MSHMGSDLKLHDRVTGLKMCAIRIKGPVKSSILYSFTAPHPIPAELLPQNCSDTRASIAAFGRINQYLKRQIVFLD